MINDSLYIVCTVYDYNEDTDRVGCDWAAAADPWDGRDPVGVICEDVVEALEENERAFNKRFLYTEEEAWKLREKDESLLFWSVREYAEHIYERYLYWSAKKNAEEDE